MGDELLLNFGSKFQRSFTISHVRLQYYHGNLLYISVPRWQQSFFKNVMNEAVRALKYALEKLNSQMSTSRRILSGIMSKNSGNCKLKL